jgi:hypothetical protein
VTATRTSVVIQFFYNTDGRPGVLLAWFPWYPLPTSQLLKQTHGPWTERDLSRALNVSSADAKQAVAAMQLQGYAEPIARTQKWRTTEEGRTVSGAKTARFTRQAVEQAFSALHDRIQGINNDKGAEYAVSEALHLEISYSSNRAFRPRTLESGLHRERPIQRVRLWP